MLIYIERVHDCNENGILCLHVVPRVCISQAGCVELYHMSALHRDTEFFIRHSVFLLPEFTLLGI